MKRVLQFPFLLSLATVLLYSCTKNDEPIYSSCQLTRIVQPGDTAALSTRYSYDANGFLTRIQATNYAIDITYSGNKVIKSEPGVSIEYTIGPDSLAISSRQITANPGDPVYTVEYFYDANKYLVKTVGFFDGVRWDSTWRTVDNGNVVQHSYRQHNTVVDIVNDYSYYTDLEAKLWTYTKLGGEYGYFYYPWLGRPNKNLMKRQSQGTFQMADYKYEFNSSGFISKIIYTSLDSNPPYSVNWSLEHDCKE